MLMRFVFRDHNTCMGRGMTRQMKRIVCISVTCLMMLFLVSAQQQTPSYADDTKSISVYANGPYDIVIGDQEYHSESDKMRYFQGQIGDVIRVTAGDPPDGYALYQIYTYTWDDESQSYRYKRHYDTDTIEYTITETDLSIDFSVNYVKIENLKGKAVLALNDKDEPVEGVKMVMTIGFLGDRTVPMSISDAEGVSRTAPDIFSIERISISDSDYEEYGWLDGKFDTEACPVKLLDYPEQYWAEVRYRAARGGIEMYTVKEGDYLNFLWGFGILDESGQYIFGEEAQARTSGGAYIKIENPRHFRYLVRLHSIPTGGIKIKKIDAKDPGKTLEGATFKIIANINPVDLNDPSLVYQDRSHLDTTMPISSLLISYGYDELYEMLYGDDEIRLNGNTYKSGEVVLTVTTDANGIADTEKKLPMLTKYGQEITYTVIEESAPAGYLVDKERVVENATLTENGYIEYAVTNTKNGDDPNVERTTDNDNDVQPDDETTTIANKNAKSDGNSSTGDSVNLYVYILLIASLVVITTIVLCSRRRSGNTNK